MASSGSKTMRLAASRTRQAFPMGSDILRIGFHPPAPLSRSRELKQHVLRRAVALDDARGLPHPIDEAPEIEARHDKARVELRAQRRQQLDRLRKAGRRDGAHRGWQNTPRVDRAEEQVSIRIAIVEVDRVEHDEIAALVVVE